MQIRRAQFRVAPSSTLAVALLLSCATAVASDVSHSVLNAADTSGRHDLRSVSLHFERNDGQAAAPVRYLARGRDYTVFLTPDAVVWSLGGEQRAAVRLGFADARAAARIEGHRPRPEKHHYLLGNDAATWRRNVPVFDEVRYRALYDGVDLVFHSRRDVPEYDFVVQPGARPEAIGFVVEGATPGINAHGDLVLESGAHTLVQRAPLVYQEIDGRRVNVDGRFVLRAPRRVGFEIAHYDPAYPLVIDPVISYATMLGGGGADIGRAVAVNATGIYVTGETDSIDFPAKFGAVQESTAGNTDVFVVKLNPSGTSIHYATYLGGGGDDVGNGIAIDTAGNAYFTGETTSADFPLQNPRDSVCGTGSSCNGGLADAFVAKLNTTGTALSFSTYHGGSATDSAAAIAVDSAGNAYVGGETAGGLAMSAAFQVSIGGSVDGFVSKFSSTGTLTYSTYLGGASDDSITGIAVDGAGSAYVTGVTFSNDFPKTGGAYQETAAGAGDAFVTKLNAAGNALSYSTYLGGTSFERGFAIAVDGSGNAYVTGATTSLDYPTLNPAQAAQASGGITRDAFVTKFNSTGTALGYSTYLGGEGIDVGNAIAVNASGAAFVVGQTVAPDFPTTHAMQGFLLGDSDAFAASLSNTGTLVYATYLGGAGVDAAFGVALDSADVAHITGQTWRAGTSQGGTSQIDDLYAGSDTLLPFPSVSALQGSLRGDSDAFIARIATTLSADLAVTKVDNSTSSVIVGQPYSSTVTVANNGPNTADEIVLVDSYPVSFDEPLSLAVSAAVPSQGTCTVDGKVVVCALGALATGGSATVAVTYVAAEPSPHTRVAFIARASESDPAATNNFASVTTRIVTSGSGGGIVDMLWLAVLAVAAARSRQARYGRTQIGQSTRLTHQIGALLSR